MTDKTPEELFKEAYASDPVKAVLEELVGMDARVKYLEAKEVERDPIGAKLDIILGALTAKPENE